MYIYKSSLYKIISFKHEITITTTTIIIIMNFNYARPIKCLKTGYKKFKSLYRFFGKIFTQQQFLHKITFPNENDKWTKDELENMHINIYSINVIFDISDEVNDNRYGINYYLVARQIINNKPIYFLLRAFNEFYNEYDAPVGEIVLSKHPKEFFEHFSDEAFKKRAISFLEKEEEERKAKEEKYILRSNTKFQIGKVNELAKQIETMSDIKTREHINDIFKNIVDFIKVNHQFISKATPTEELEHWSEKELLAMIISLNDVDAVFKGFWRESFDELGCDYYLVARQIVNCMPIYFEMMVCYQGFSFPYVEGKILFSKFPEIFINDFISNSFKRKARVFLKNSFKIQIKDEEGGGKERENGKRKRGRSEGEEKNKAKKMHLII